MVKKEVDGKLSLEDNSLGLVGWSFGFAGLIMSMIFPFGGVVFGVIGLVVSNKQNKKSVNTWSRAGKILSIVTVVLSIVVISLSILSLSYLSSNPQFQALLNQ